MLAKFTHEAANEHFSSIINHRMSRKTEDWAWVYNDRGTVVATAGGGHVQRARAAQRENITPYGRELGTVVLDRSVQDVVRRAGGGGGRA